MDYYWVTGGGGVWNSSDDLNWSDSSGGTGGGFGVPTSSDNVIFDANSGGGTVTIGEFMSCNNIDTTGSGIAFYIANFSSLTVYGNLDFTGSTSWTSETLNNGVSFNGTGGGTRTINSGGVVIGGNMAFSASAATWDLAANIEITGQLQHNIGTINLNDFTFACNTYTSTGTGVRTFNYGAGTLELKYGAVGNTTIYTTSNATNLTITGQTTGLIRVTGNTASTRTIVMDSSPLVLAPSIEVSAGSGTITFSSVNCYNFTATSGYTGVLNSSLSVYGDFQLDAANGSPSLALVMAATSGTKNITTAGKTITNLTINGAGGTFQVANNSLTTGILTLTAGTFDANDFDVTSTSFSGSGTGVRGLYMGSGTWTMTSTSIVWNLLTSTNLTFDSETSTIRFTNNSASSKTFVGGGLTYNTYWNDTAGAGVCIMTGSNTFKDIFRVNGGRTQHFTAGTTTTAATWDVFGTAGNLVTLTSATSAQHTLAKSGGGTVDLEYLNVSYSIASPSSTFSAENSTDGGNNTDWTFVSAATGHTNLLLLGVG